MTSAGPITLTLAHSPDPDDVFMWWPLGALGDHPIIDTGPFRFDCIPSDIQALNARAIESGDLDISAISINAYPHIKQRYQLTACAGSFGEGYGPKLVARTASIAALDEPLDLLRRSNLVIAVPGPQTTAMLVARLLIEEGFRALEMPFDRIPGAVADGEADAGLLIHDAQLTFESIGLQSIVDLGQWWGRRTGFPLPLGGNVVRRDLEERFGSGTLRALAGVLEDSIAFVLEHWQEGVDRLALRFPDLERPVLDQYLRMYVSEMTRDAGRRGAQAISHLLAEAWRLRLGPDPHPIDLLASTVDPGLVHAPEREEA